MSTEDLEKYETEMELQLYREYRDIVRQFTYVVETERRFYLANSVDLQVREAGGEVYFELKLSDAWVWDMYRPARFVRNVRVLTFKDVNVEELDKPDLELPDNPRLPDRLVAGLHPLDVADVEHLGGRDDGDPPAGERLHGQPAGGGEAHQRVDRRPAGDRCRAQPDAGLVGVVVVHLDDGLDVHDRDGTP